MFTGTFTDTLVYTMGQGQCIIKNNFRVLYDFVVLNPIVLVVALIFIIDRITVLKLKFAILKLEKEAQFNRDNFEELYKKIYYLRLYAKASKFKKNKKETDECNEITKKQLRPHSNSQNKRLKKEE